MKSVRRRASLSAVPTLDRPESPCAVGGRPHPSQLLLPFTEAESTADAGTASRGDVDLLARGATSGPPITPSKRLDALRAYLRRRFPGFVLQQRTQPAGTVQLSLYRIPDGAFYRVNVTSRFLDGDWLDELDRFLEYHALCEKVPASALAPIIIDRDGIHVPRPPLPAEEGGDLLRSRLRRILGWKGKEDATGLSFAP